MSLFKVYLLKAVFVKEKKTITVDELSSPKPGSSDVLVKMRACGLCGSDLEKVYGNYGMSSGRLGHEPSGEIVGVGDLVSGYSVGDRVFVHHHVPCYSCHYCRHGDYTMCTMFHSSNLDPCGLSEEILVPGWNVSRGGVIKLPSNVTFEKAALIEPLACCIRALDKSRIQKGDDIAIFGAGPAGIMLALLAQSMGCGKIFLIDINQFRLDLAEKHFQVECFNINIRPDAEESIRGATGGRGVDISVVATGNPQAMVKAFSLTRRAGKIILFGVPGKGTQLMLDASLVYSNEWLLVPSYAASEIETNQSSRLLNNNRIEMDWIITHRFGLNQAEEAIRCAHEAKDSMKVVVTA
ncbi:MAG TPA: alcohol dehydrogenase catalytic domain-containing protein [Nitrososphaeraceae archaeon]|nr:alcohol dehydrogenase catalytic domain-containing protein [Nitrososphaeraceae archaeon]